MLYCDRYLVPKTMDEAFELMESCGSSYRIVAGATDLLPWAREGRAGDVNYDTLIDISKIPELSGWELNGSRLRLGANVTFSRFLNDPFLRRHIPLMTQTAVWFADDQIRELATLGGNLVNASPAADGAPPMLAMNAVLTLQRRENGQRVERDLPLEEFVVGPGITQLKPGELLTDIECDSMIGHGTAFEKVGHRRSLVLSTVCVAAAIQLSKDRQSFKDVRLALGAVGPAPVRLHECEDFLTGKLISGKIIARASRLSVKRVMSRTRQAYRREVVFNFVKRGILNALSELGVNLPDHQLFQYPLESHA